MGRLCFLGNPEVAAVRLRALHHAGHDIALVVTADEARRARRAGPTPTPVKRAADGLGLPVTYDVSEVTQVGAELAVVVAFGRLIRRELLDSLPMVNVHFSLLPRWRGAAPVEWAILAGDSETGVCLMAVEEGLDTGGVYGCVASPIGEEETAAELRSRLGEMGAGLLVERLAHGPAGLGEPEPQEGEATYARKLTAEDRRLDFAEASEVLVRVVRVGRAWTTFRGSRLLVHRARAVEGDTSGFEPGALTETGVATAKGWLLPEVVQPEGRRMLAFGEWLRGAHVDEGEVVGMPADEGRR